MADAASAGPWARALLRLLSRGHAVAAELHRVADGLPPTLAGAGPEAARLAPVLPDFAVFRSEDALARVAGTPELIELDEESRDLHQRAAARVFRLLAAIRKYALDLCGFLSELEAGAYVGCSLESVVRGPEGAQLLSEAIGMLGSTLLVLDERVPGPVRERALVLFHRCTVGTSEESDDFPSVCRLFRSTGRPVTSAEMAARSAGYPEQFFERFAVPQEAVRVVVGQLQTRDVYDAALHYPLPEHRSHGLSAQAGLLYVVLFFDPRVLAEDGVAMREIVNRHFADVCVVAYALGFTADLLAAWAPYPAAREALAGAVTAASMARLRARHRGQLETARRQLADFLVEGALTEEVVTQKTGTLLACLRQSNTTIRWLLLQSTTCDPRLRPVFHDGGQGSVAELSEELIGALVDTALLEERVRSLLGALVARREADWAELQAAAAQAMDDLALFFSGQHALRRNVRNEQLEAWFRDLHGRIEALSYSTEEDALVLGRRVTQLCNALEEVEQFHEVARQPQILHFLADARGLLQRMLRTANLSGGTLQTITTVADLSYAWNLLESYERTMHSLLAKSAGSVRGLRALFLKLASILEAPMRRIRQAGNEAHGELVSSYYSASLVTFMRSVLQEIPRLIFGILADISRQEAARPPDSSRISLVELQDYAERSDAARHQVTLLTQRIALLMRGIRETDVAVLGALVVQPQSILVDGLRRELARHLEELLSGLRFPAKVAARCDASAPMEALAAQMATLRRAFEHVQDYLGVSALQMWHEEFGRVAQFLLHAELHQLLRRRAPPPGTSPHHDPNFPVAYPDAAGPAAGGGCFVSRVAAALLQLSEPKGSRGGLREEWWSESSGDCPLDGLLFETAQRALGAPGIAAVCSYLGMRAACLLRKLFESMARLLGADAGAAVRAVAARAREHSAGGGGELLRAVQSERQRLEKQLAPLADLAAQVGQHQLLRRRLASSLRLHARLGSPALAEALSALDGACLGEALEDVAVEQAQSELMSVFDFVGEDDLGSGRARLQQRLARVAELPGLGDPLRQLLAVPGAGPLAEGCPELHALLALLLLSSPLAAPRAAAAARPAGRKAKKAGAEAQSEEPQRREVGAATLAGLATVLQQLPQAHTVQLLELLGAYVRALCAEAPEGAGGGDAAAEVAALADGLGELLEVLGLQREYLAEFAPHGVAELWAAE